MWPAILLFVIASGNGLPEEISRDAMLSTPQLLTQYGYTSETHQVKTEDGYILTMHRIPNGRIGQNDTTIRPPILLQHGLLSSSADWVVTRPEIALAYLLADAGYDVWMGNFRGNTYSKQHVRYTAKDKEYWDFSWNENGIFDLPAMIDYVLATTNNAQLFYAGHSMGTTSFFVMCSQKPEYNKKIRLMFSLAPIAYMNHVTSPLLKAVAWTYRGDEWLWNALGWYEFLPSNELIQQGGMLLCQEQAISHSVCSDTLFILVGWDSKNLNATNLPVLLAHTPAGASAKQLLHYSQLVVSGHFRKWDYGVISNMFKYSSASPPDYDLSKVTAPVVLMYSDNDWMANIVDVKKLGSSLGNLVEMFHVQDTKFNHMDYLWAINSRQQVYQPLVDRMKKY